MTKQARQKRIYSNHNELTLIVNTEITQAEISPDNLKILYIEVKDPQGMQKQLVIESHLIGDLIKDYGIKDYKSLVGKRVRAIYNSDKIVGIIPRKSMRKKV